MEKRGKIFSPGKLLLTSEYVVLDGAKALAIPTKQGQEFFFEEIQDGLSIVTWEALHLGKPWLEVKIDYSSWEILSFNLDLPSQFILQVLKNVQKLSEEKFQNQDSYQLKTNLQFPPNFGFGSSSTLMNNLADWAEIDAFILNELCLGGSGYDIAVAQKKSPIIFQNNNGIKNIEVVNFSPTFQNELIFFHLNKKQDSREGINLYKRKEKSVSLIEEFTEITEAVIKTDDLEVFSNLMEIHETKLSHFLSIPTLKELHFSNCPTFIKSLGAWGGDFFMTSKFDGYKDYFSEKGFSTVLDWSAIKY